MVFDAYHSLLSLLDLEMSFINVKFSFPVAFCRDSFKRFSLSPYLFLDSSLHFICVP
jgi:hypothetical protein